MTLVGIVVPGDNVDVKRAGTDVRQALPVPRPDFPAYVGQTIGRQLCRRVPPLSKDTQVLPQLAKTL